MQSSIKLLLLLLLVLCWTIMNDIAIFYHLLALEIVANIVIMPWLTKPRGALFDNP